jgi:hypothetical protein
VIVCEPGAGDHREHRTILLGKPLTLTGPFAFDPETTDFL